MRHVIGSMLLGCAALAAPLPSVAQGYPWRDHAPPYDFRFGNDIDTHQQSRETQDGGLAGFLYVHYTGETTAEGLPLAHHADCATMPCAVGWTIDARPMGATFLYHVEGDHPVWLVDRADIPQPGAYAHFHWLGGGSPAAGDTLAGYVLQLRAIASFCFVHHHDGNGGDGSCRGHGGVAVAPGIDIATHLNIVASFP
jgi:hypothetical protein